MTNHLHVLFAGVGQLPTCKQCYYTTTEPLKPKHFKSFTVAKLDFTIHRLSSGRPNCGLKNTGMQPFMQQVQINIESTNLSEQTQPVLLSLLILFIRWQISSSCTVCVTLPTRWTRLWVWMFKGCCVCFRTQSN